MDEVKKRGAVEKTLQHPVNRLLKVNKKRPHSSRFVKLYGLNCSQSIRFR